jgi:hypothetical protein
MPLPARLPNPGSLLSAGFLTTLRGYFQGSRPPRLKKARSGPVLLNGASLVVVAEAGQLGGQVVG